MDPKQHFRGLVWPRQNKDTPPAIGGDAATVYRYVVVGMLLTGKPIPGMDKNEVVLDGHPAGLTEALESIPQAYLRCPVATADDFLCSLEWRVTHEPPYEDDDQGD